VFERDDPAAADAEVFALIAQALAGLPLRAVTGDIGVLMAVVQGLETSELRKRALMRHIWRPRRFRAMLSQFAGRSPARVALSGTAPQVGKRRQSEIDARIDALRADAEVPPLEMKIVELIETLLAIAAPLPHALARLHDLSVDLPAIVPAVMRVDARMHALAARGVDVDTLLFDASHGRASMEYYDGFVFAFRAQNRADLPPVATGGRYDALTRRLGGGREIPAVGGVMRPGLMLMLEAGQ
jgi:ATP phosphoribosyltransferase regulatory subunit